MGFMLITTPLAKGAAQVFSDTPLCITLKNNAGHEVLGHIETDAFYDSNGKMSWHRSNFKLQPDAEQQACSTGPFFEGYQLRVVLKSLMPLYSCKTEMNRIITITRGKDENGIDGVTADCPSERSQYSR